MERYTLEIAIAWLQSVLDSTGRDYPKVSLTLKAGGDAYALIIEGPERRVNVDLKESVIYGIANGNEAIRSQVAENILGFARDSEWKLEDDAPGGGKP